MVGSGGVMEIETRTAAVTVRTVEPVIAPEVALMVAVPVARLVARPVALMPAVEGGFEAQVAVEVRFCVCKSVKVPVAVNCWVLPNAIEGVAVSYTHLDVYKRQVKVEQSSELWDLEHYLTQRRQDINRKYDYRYSVLLFVFANLVREGRVSEEELRSLGEDKLAYIRWQTTP